MSLLAVASGARVVSPFAVPGRRSARRYPYSLSVLLLAVYLLAAGLSPLLHHDLLCHVQSPTHCTTCLTGSAAEHAGHSASLDGLSLVAIGAVVAAPEGCPDAVLAGDLSGRSPPSR